LRLWDSRTTWRDLQPSPGRWNFGTLDALLATAAAHGTSDITLVLAGTPQWASVRTSPADAPWIGPGSASPPRDLHEWSAYVATVAARYRGRISTYEIGNEPNLPTFWNGTPAQWAGYVAVAASAIRSADPSATVVADVGLIRGARDLPAVGQFAGLAAISPYVDAFAIHAYPSRRTLATMPDVLAHARALLTAVGAGGRPVWVTEVNVSDGSSLSDSRQRAAVRLLTRAIASAGYARAFWYAWTALGPANLIQLAPRTPGAAALQQVLGDRGEPIDSVGG
jgi:GH35 family endo-1,4-beta-xylanase